ncbi:hypothetical protein EJ110_NYTH13026 [Nymphaea thermarum]|nr:hypothetical protein EJ110_NYTH13026 [Nymphaea thermarum]
MVSTRLIPPFLGEKRFLGRVADDDQKNATLRGRKRDASRTSADAVKKSRIDRKIWALTSFFWMRRVLVWNSTPTVALQSSLNSFFENRFSSCDFPTAESPITTTLNT